MGTIIDAARWLIDRIEATKDDVLLSRDPEFVGSLHEADQELRDRRTVSLDDLRAELDPEEHPPLAY
jgi:hypothetical protein